MEFNPAFHPWKPNLYPALARRSIALFLARAFWGRRRPYRSRAHAHTGIMGLSHLAQPALGRGSVLRATLLITFSLSGTLHLCL